MHRIDGPAAAPGGQFTEGDPNVGTPASVVTDDWLNAIQEEISSVIEGTGTALAKPNNAQLLAAIRALIDAAVPPGKVAPFARVTAPNSWSIADGGELNRTADARLFAVIGTTFGAGNGTTTFNKPNLCGEFVRGLDLGRGVDPGRVLGSPQADEIKSHSHATDWQMAFEGGSADNRMASGSSLESNHFQLPTEGTGGTETRPRNVALLYCIKL